MPRNTPDRILHLKDRVPPYWLFWLRKLNKQVVKNFFIASESRQVSRYTKCHCLICFILFKMHRNQRRVTIYIQLIHYRIQGEKKWRAQLDGAYWCALKKNFTIVQKHCPTDKKRRPSVNHEASAKKQHLSPNENESIPNAQKIIPDVEVCRTSFI